MASSVLYVKRYYYSAMESGGYCLDWTKMVVVGYTRRGNYRLDNGEIYDRITKKCVNFSGKTFIELMDG